MIQSSTSYHSPRVLRLSELSKHIYPYTQCFVLLGLIIYISVTTLTVVIYGPSEVTVEKALINWGTLCYIHLSC